LPGVDGAWVSPESGPYSSNSDSCAAGHCVLAVTCRRTYLAEPDVVIVTVLPLAGANA
jgi:hypothetical protein